MVDWLRERATMSIVTGQADFDALQRKLVPLWKSIQTFSSDPQTIVAVPSLSVDVEFGGVLLQAYEERFLFLLLLLRQPRARLVYVTSQAIHPDVIDYYLGLLPGVIPSHAKKRLFLVSPLDGSARPLSLKLLERPRLLAHIRSLIPDPDRAHLVPYSTTPAERDLALRLGIPMYGADPKFLPFGTKSGARRIFADEGIPHPLGVEHLHTPEQIVDAVSGMRARKGSLQYLVVKLNEGISGFGNATLDLTGLPAGPSDRAAIAARLETMAFEDPRHAASRSALSRATTCSLATIAPSRTPTCSTWPSVMGCTSIRPARRAWSFT